MLHIHRAERADRLVEVLAGVVAEPLDDPLQPEVVAVPTRGVERWLTQRMSAHLGTSRDRGDGVCANVDFPFPGRLVGGAVATATGVDRLTDPWLPERAVWPLLEVVDASLGRPWLEALTAHLGGAGPDPDRNRRARRFAEVRHLADLFDRYAVHRPAMVQAWAGGDDSDGDGQPLPGDLAWQARLWRSLRARIDVASPAERLADGCRRLREDPGIVDLPSRISLFGLTRLPASFLAVLNAIAGGREVHLFLLHPSPVLWDRVAALLPAGAPPPRRAHDPTATLAGNPLLASWGQDAREMQLVVTAAAEHPVVDHRPARPEPATLLRRLQADVCADRSPPGVPVPGEQDRRSRLDPGDRTVEVHACHGRARQVEVVRDAVLHLLAADTSLQPRDVIVMCPDIEAFAPLIHAAFGAGGDIADADEDPAAAGPRPQGLRVRLADRSLRQTNPVLRVVSDLLALADGRLTASELLDLAAREPVRRRFGFDDHDLERLEDWVPAAGIRWGLDAGHRAPFKLERVAANTWSAGLDRVLLGVAMSEDGQRLFGGTLPLDDVASGDIDLAGRFAELLGRLTAALDGLAGPQPIAAWGSAIATAADTLTAIGSRDAWQRAQLQRLLDDLVGEATRGDAASAASLTLAEVRAVVADRLRGRPTRANFRTGHLTVCTMVPMRSVPHRVVCLLGLDDGRFPRRTAVDGDDLMNRDPSVGDRDPRSEDRQLLLDALLAATDHLVITYTGRDERTNTPRPPAVPVGELLDVVDATVTTGEVDDDGAEVPARRRVVVEHPLQPFDGRNFTSGALVAGRPWSFDGVALDGARALAATTRQRPPFLDGPLPATDLDVVELADLVRFVQHPVKAFLRQRLGVSLSEETADPADALPLDLDALEWWAAGDRLLAGRLRGLDAATCAAAERARGQLPPDRLADRYLNWIGPIVDGIVDVADQVAASDRQAASMEVSVPLGDSVVVGTVPDMAGDLLRLVTFSRVAAKHRLAAWVRLLAVTAAHPELAVSAVTVGRRMGRGRGVTVVRIPALDDDPAVRGAVAARHLADVVELYRRGMCEPLPLYCDTSAAWADAASQGREPETAARDAWTSDYTRDREDKHPEHQLVLGGVLPFQQLLSELPCDGEDAQGWDLSEPTRFGRYARRLWDGLLAREQVSRG